MAEVIYVLSTITVDHMVAVYHKDEDPCMEAVPGDSQVFEVNHKQEFKVDLRHFSWYNPAKEWNVC
jgi:hypothetical protein